MAESKLMSRVERALGEFAARAHQKPKRTLLLVAVLTAVGAYLSQGLQLKADLENLLPSTFPSVKGLEPVKERFGGIGYMVVVGMGGDEASLKRFADDYAPKLEKLEGVRYVDYKRAAGFFIDRALYQLSVEDLDEVYRRIKEREKFERRALNPMFVQLDDEEPPSLDMSDIEAKYGKRSDQRLSTGGDYYLDPDKKMVVLMAKPSQVAMDLSFSEKLVKQFEDYFAKEDLSKYGKDFRVGFTGTFKYKVDQQRQLNSDITKASLLALIILLVYLVFHFRSFLAVGLVLGPVSAGLAWTYGITALSFGSLNILTGFLGAILGGLGTEHGIHLIGRYQVLRGKGVSSEEAVREAFSHTGGSALVSSVVAALTFLTISFSEFRAFHEFGLIAALGMVVVLLAYMLTLPGLLGVAARFNWKAESGSHAVSGEGSQLAALLPKLFRPVAFVSMIVLAFFIARMSGVRFDFDFHSLEDSRLPSWDLDKETNRILGYNMEPVVILTKNAKTERQLVRLLKERQKAQGDKSTIDFVAALDDLVPDHQQEKKEILGKIDAVLQKVSADKLEPATKEKFEQLQRMVRAEPFTRADIPISVRRQFEGIGGDKAEGGFVLIFPNFLLTDGIQVRNFAKDVRGVQLEGGESYSAAGESMILADVLEMVIRESPPILMAAILSVLLAMWLTLGGLRVAVVCMAPTVVSILALVGLMAMIDMPFNYLNILIVPVLIGVTVDAGVHLMSRLEEAHQEAGSFTSVFAETGRAICGGLITSGVGFGAMLLADHPGLNSLGRLANLGFAMNLLVMLVAFPAAVLLLQRSKLFKPKPVNSPAPSASNE